MSDNEIIKALECCSDTIGVNCGKCPYCDNCVTDENTSLMMTDAIALINRQKAEIERLTAEHDKSFEKWEILDKRTKERYAKLYEEAKEILKAEAYKEFAERLKDNTLPITLGGKYRYYVISKEGIDNTLKEMTEKGK